jgi:epoxide hydrolase 4
MSTVVGKHIDGLTLERADIGDVDIHYAHMGEGELMLFVHGWPRHWYLWRHQLPEFGRDHRAVALDLRGYNLSSKPAGDHHYGVRHNVEDIRALADHLGYYRFTLVGHDIGGGAAFAFALHYPERLERLVVMSCPHPAKLEWAVRHDEPYREIAHYLYGLSAPDAPEQLAAHDYAAIRPPCLDFDFLDEDDRAAYLEAWSRPGAWRAMLAPDRREGFNAGWRDGELARGNYVPGVPTHVVKVPTLLMYTESDPINPPSLFEGTEEWVEDLTLKRFPGTHWMPEENAEIVNREIREFIRAQERAGASA